VILEKLFQKLAMNVLYVLWRKSINDSEEMPERNFVMRMSEQFLELGSVLKKQAETFYLFFS
jgi:hypothetical protein